MTLALAAAVPVVLATAFGGAFMVNEWSHGGLSEAVGLGHHHMLDYSGVHCAAHGGDQAMAHAAHMHGAAPVAHDACPGGAAMHAQAPALTGAMRPEAMRHA